MQNRDVQIAEAVRDAQFNTDLPLFDSDLLAIIASIPAPEPVAVTSSLQIEAMHNGYSRAVTARDPRFAAISPRETDVPLYTSPPATGINRQLLDALRGLVKFNMQGWYDSEYSPTEIRIAKAAIAAAEKELK